MRLDSGLARQTPWMCSRFRKGPALHQEMCAPLYVLAERPADQSRRALMVGQSSQDDFWSVMLW